jgi:hypothetical protein
MAGAKKRRSKRKEEKESPTVVVVVVPVLSSAPPDDKWSRRSFFATLASVVLGGVALLYPQTSQSPLVATAPARTPVRDEVKLSESLHVRITPGSGQLRVAANAPTVNVATAATTTHVNVSQPPL